MSYSVKRTAQPEAKHVDDVESCLVCNGRLYTGSDDGFIKVRVRGLPSPHLTSSITVSAGTLSWSWCMSGELTSMSSTIWLLTRVGIFLSLAHLQAVRAIDVQLNFREKPALLLLHGRRNQALVSGQSGHLLDDRPADRTHR